MYDKTGRPYKLIVTEGTTKYTGFYILNLQGDVIGIVDTSGAKAVTYEYSAWGTLIGNSTSGTNGGKLNTYNALKYRGYYYDADLADTTCMRIVIIILLTMWSNEQCATTERYCRKE